MHHRHYLGWRLGVAKYIKEAVVFYTQGAEFRLVISSSRLP
jgi:hypothetical protein